MRDDVLRVRLIGDSQAAVTAATEALCEAVATLMRPVELRFRPPRPGRRGEWLGYGRMHLIAPPEVP